MSIYLSSPVSGPLPSSLSSLSLSLRVPLYLLSPFSHPYLSIFINLYHFSSLSLIVTPSLNLPSPYMSSSLLTYTSLLLCPSSVLIVNYYLKCSIFFLFIIDGYTYERSAIMSWFMEGNRRSPTTNITLPNTTLFPNYTLRSILQSTY